MNIRIKEFINDDTAVSYEDGKACLKLILKVIEDDKITLDFDGVNYVITAFLNPIIGDLILEKGPEIMGRISILNANEATISKIKMVRDGALLKREDME
ncbi:MAG: STAS-like domain-containing protein [Eubacteriales bacterium]|nr:STAS-like domain-containing protein [Eubacteriales bacterium]